MIWYKPNWALADPVCTILFSFIVIYTTMGVVKSTVNVLLEGVPSGVDYEKVKFEISSVSGVSNLHDLHIWSISIGKPALSCHLSAANPRQALIDIRELCARHEIIHTTVQVQFPTDKECLTCDGVGCA